MTYTPIPAIRHLVVLAHPSRTSFNRSVADAYCDAVGACGQEAALRDLYAIGFDPALKDEERPGTPGFKPAPDVAEELSLLRDCAVVTLVYPIWFGMPPAMLKGYIDRVLGSGFLASQIKHGEPHPLLHGKRMMIFTTSASTRPWLDEMGQWESLRQAFDNYLQTIFSMQKGDHLHFDAVTPDLNAGYAAECLAEVELHARKVCSEVLRERRALQVQQIREMAGS